MCRLYGFRSSAPRKVECELIASQNSLIKQSDRDEDGNRNVHGWGLAAYSNGRPYVRKQPAPAVDSEDFRLEAGELFSTDILAHVRRATVAPVTIENTHPFLNDDWTFIHNGEIVEYEAVQPILLEAIIPRIRATIEGETDSELIFRYLVSLHEKNPGLGLFGTLKTGLHQVIDWVQEAAPGSDVSLNVLLTDGRELAGARYGRALWYTERDAVHQCEVCGGMHHASEVPSPDYRAVVVSSERLTKNDDWQEVTDHTFFGIDEELNMTIEAV